MASPRSRAPESLADVKTATWIAAALPLAFLLHTMLFKNIVNGNSKLMRMEFTYFLAVAALAWLGKVSEFVPEPYLVSLGKSTTRTVCL